MNLKLTTKQTTGIMLIIYFLLGMTCYFVLASAFQFPDILRVDGAERFEKFYQGKTIIVPTYYFWTFTGVILIVISVLCFSLSKEKKTYDYLAVISGILSGVFQILGFIRWVVFVPLLSRFYQDSIFPKEQIFAIEQLANSYLGMSVGEHLGNLFFAFWIIFLSLRLKTETHSHSSISNFGIIGGFFFLLFSFESLGGIFSFLSNFTVAMWATIYVWMLLLAVCLLRKQNNTKSRPLHWGFWLGGIIFWLLNVIPVYMG